MADIVVVGGYGYVGRSIALWSASNGYDTVVYASESSISKRMWLKKLYDHLGVETISNRGIGKTPPQELLRVLRSSKYVVYTLGAKKGGRIDMYISNSILPYLLVKTLSKYTGTDTLHIHVDAYTSGCGESVYAESKCLSKRLLGKLAGETPLLILESGLVIGRFPTHPEWMMMYMMARSRVIFDQGIKTGFTPSYELIPAAEHIYILHGPGLYNTVMYVGSLATIPLYMSRLMGKNPIVIPLHIPNHVTNLMPRHGELGFIRSFLDYRPEKSTLLYRSGYRPRYGFRRSVERAYRDLTLLKPLPTKRKVRII